VARSMFRDVVDPSIHVGQKHPYTLPLSIAVHVVLVGALIVIPLVAPVALPAPATAVILAFASVAPPPPPPPAPVRATQIEQPKSIITQAAAPLEARADIAPEHQTPETTQLLSTVEGSGATVPGAEIGIPGSPGPLPPPPPKTEAPSGPVRPGGNVKPPTKIKDVKPIYPVIAQISKVEGIVIIEATIGPNGKVQDAKVLRSHPLLEGAALDAVRQWEFTPTLLNGSPVSVVMTVTVDFRLRLH
jgi:periplasmic protein TonB